MGLVGVGGVALCRRVMHLVGLGEGVVLDVVDLPVGLSF